MLVSFVERGLRVFRWRVLPGVRLFVQKEPAPLGDRPCCMTMMWDRLAFRLVVGCASSAGYHAPVARP